MQIKHSEYEHLINLLTRELDLIKSSESKYPIIDSLEELKIYGESLKRKMLLASLLKEAKEIDKRIDKRIDKDIREKTKRTNITSKELQIEIYGDLINEYRRYIS